MKEILLQLELTARFFGWSKSKVHAALLLLCLSFPAMADVGQGESGLTLNITNTISSTNAVVSGYPTNASGSNYLGGAVDIGSVDNFTIDVQGFLVNTNSTNGAKEWDFALCSAAVSQGSPTITTNTNSWSNNQIITNQNDFVTNNSMLFRVPLPPSWSNWFHWRTNVSAPNIYQNDSHVGMSYSSNNLDPNCFLSFNPSNTGNANLVKIIKKVKPIRFQ